MDEWQTFILARHITWRVLKGGWRNSIYFLFFWHLRRYYCQLTDFVCKIEFRLYIMQLQHHLLFIFKEMIRKQTQCLIFVETLIKSRNTQTLSPHCFQFLSSQSISRYSKTQVVSVCALVHSNSDRDRLWTQSRVAQLCCWSSRVWFPAALQCCILQ